MKPHHKFLVHALALVAGAAAAFWAGPARAQAAAQAPAISLSTNGKAALPIVIAADAGERTKQLAGTLAEYLGRMSGGKFEVTTGDGKTGIAIGLPAGFPALGLAQSFDANDPARREEYELRSDADGLSVIGATEAALSAGVWDLLHRLGYRHFFPGDKWEIVPRQPTLRLAVNTREKPDYQSRRIWFTYGTWPDNNKRMADWNARNRMGGVALNTGHAYGAIVHQNRAEFLAHPEWFAEVGGVRKVPSTQREIEGVKFDLSNPELRAAIVRHALRYFEQNPDAHSISVDPSDGGNWGQTEAEKKIGSVSDRVTLLANEVAEAVNKKYPGKLVGFYAYNQHSPPPSIKVHPRVVVSVATAFITGGYTIDQLTEGWKKQGATLGMREYYSIIHWDKDLPLRARAGRLESLARGIKHYHDSGARFMSAESSDNWGPNGLGYYLASRMLWDVEEGNRIPAIVEDFLQTSFGPAKEPARQWYGLINGIGGAKSIPFGEDYIGRLYRALEAAYKLTDDGAIRGRLDDLALYTRYLELWSNYSSSKGAPRQAAYEEMIRFAYQIRDSHMLHSLAIYRTGMRDKSVKIPAEAHWQVAATDKAKKPLNPWKQAPPPTAEEVQTMVRAGVAANKLLDFEPQSFGDDLVTAAGLNLAPVTPMEVGQMRGSQNLLVAVREPGPIKLHVIAGTIYKSRGPAFVRLFSTETPDAEGEDAEAEAAVPIAPIAIQTVEVPPDQKEHEVVLQAPRPGLYRVNISDRMMGVRVRWTPGMPVAMPSSLDARPAFSGRWNGYFYVPKGTNRVGGFAFGGGRVMDANNKVIFDYPAKDGYFSIEVPEGQDGKLWSFQSANGQIGLMTTPPYLFRSAEEVLLPKEVVDKDAR